ncbi:hypothetical protein MTO96_021798 [Rhipicephalus appendiculatus]
MSLQFSAASTKEKVCSSYDSQSARCTCCMELTAASMSIVRRCCFFFMPGGVNQNPNVSRVYVDETNFNVWCARSFARAKRGTPAVRVVTSTKGANITIIACMSAGGLIHWKVVDKVHWIVFNEFLVEASKKIQENEPNGHVVFILDSAPAHHRAENATLASVTHTLKKLPTYSPFFNAVEEVFSKFKFHVKAFLSERREELLTTPPGMKKKQHRRTMLMEAAVSSMQQVQRADCESYDEHTFSFVDAALNCRDM